METRDVELVPKYGLRFLHRRVLDEHGRPQLYEVTRVALGTVYYRPLDVDSEGWSQHGGVECCEVENFDKVASIAAATGDERP